eukprot:GABV01001972.1.p2 GENE.GABV01001972.1~~GABV01001972.1.p2  ORF type:complete len:170 (-),score=44.18 GABV01001972.1:24-533(-)
MIFNVRDKNPLLPDRPLIDVGAAVVLEPMLLAGTILGVFMNVTFPGWLITLLLAILLSYATFRSGRKGLRLFRTETKERRAAQEAQQERIVELAEQGSSNNPAESSDTTEAESSSSSPPMDPKKTNLNNCSKKTAAQSSKSVLLLWCGLLSSFFPFPRWTRWDSKYDRH